jgi:predicted peptidase
VRVIVRVRGDGVRGIRPPAVLEENMPVWDFIGVHTEVAIVQSFMISVERQANVSIDDKIRYMSELQETQPNGSW